MIAAAAHLLACMVVFSLVERLWPASARRKWWRRPLLVDIVSWLIVPLAIGAGMTFAVLLMDWLKTSAPLWRWLVWLRAQIGCWPLLIQVAVAFCAVDFLHYWIHRAYHRFPFLWSFHMMHHSSDPIDWLSTLRVHPVSQMIDTAIVTGLLLFLGLPLKTLVAANALVGFSAVLTHANVPWTFGPLGRFFVSPVFHHWHHARMDVPFHSNPPANFGAALSVWDRIFKTSMDAGNQPSRYGAEKAPAGELQSLLLWPLRFCLPRRSATKEQPPMNPPSPEASARQAANGTGKIKPQNPMKLFSCKRTRQTTKKEEGEEWPRKGG